MKNNWPSWGWLLLAAVCETAWAYCLKYMEFRALRALRWETLLVPGAGLRIIAPFAGYILFGIANVGCFSMATRHIPLSTAFAAWTGISLVLIRLSEACLLQQRTGYAELFFMLMIMAGITGLKVSGQRA